MRRMPGSPSLPVSLTRAGWPPRSSTQRRISSWLVVVFESDMALLSVSGRRSPSPRPLKRPPPPSAEEAEVDGVADRALAVEAAGMTELRVHRDRVARLELDGHGPAAAERPHHQ